MNLSIEQFDEMTPYELSLFAEVYIEKILADKEEKITLAWLGEYYHRMKKLPTLKSEVKKFRVDNSSRQMSDEDMYKMAERLNLQFGGKVKRGEEDGT